MPEVKEMMPIIIPLVILQFVLLTAAIVHILRHDSYKRGNRVLWLIITIVGMEFIGPILYFIFGKEE
ncbi:MAG: PLDc N-terminal domain-containing protein [Eubacteriaceae bacterium]|nr:PLDc N-terminal domain-containing protein [Eubacteriaceae bacterium]